ncbi:hypothetical protein FVE85_9664 [Porphyridium purpureum]|uniref:Protein kinase domain-containing protein n=1 Tax=Porphyridium purpureum TaxID=35688 RepID=A0A5J4YMI4_PORPP|nr:hypothetical protein FVE85_9664 [Porphyridium purpureum]|eukprot:POR7677..scf246_12
MGFGLGKKASVDQAVKMRPRHKDVHTQTSLSYWLNPKNRALARTSSEVVKPIHMQRSCHTQTCSSVTSTVTGRELPPEHGTEKVADFRRHRTVEEISYPEDMDDVENMDPNRIVQITPSNRRLSESRDQSKAWKIYPTVVPTILNTPHFDMFETSTGLNYKGQSTPGPGGPEPEPEPPSPSRAGAEQRAGSVRRVEQPESSGKQSSTCTVVLPEMKKRVSDAEINDLAENHVIAKPALTSECQPEASKITAPPSKLNRDGQATQHVTRKMRTLERQQQHLGPARPASVQVLVQEGAAYHCAQNWNPSNSTSHVLPIRSVSKIRAGAKLVIDTFQTLTTFRVLKRIALPSSSTTSASPSPAFYTAVVHARCAGHRPNGAVTSSSTVLLKVVAPGSIWDFYIINIIRERIGGSGRADLLPFMPCAPRLFHHQDECILALKLASGTLRGDDTFVPLGTLLKGQRQTVRRTCANPVGPADASQMDEHIVAYYLHALVRVVHGMHLAWVAHGGICADVIMVKRGRDAGAPVALQHPRNPHHTNGGGGSKNVLLDDPVLLFVDFQHAVDLRLAEAASRRACGSAAPSCDKLSAVLFEADLNAIGRLVQNLLSACTSRTSRYESISRDLWLHDSLWSRIMDELCPRGALQNQTAFDGPNDTVQPQFNIFGRHNATQAPLETDAGFASLSQPRKLRSGHDTLRALARVEQQLRTFIDARAVRIHHALQRFFFSQ